MGVDPPACILRAPGLHIDREGANGIISPGTWKGPESISANQKIGAINYVDI